jgi:hypothetical protein
MKKNHFMQQQFLVKLQSNCKFVCGLDIDMVLVLYCVLMLLLLMGDGPWILLLCVGGVAR